MSSLRNKVVLITGASAGIGRAMAKKFAAEGAKLCLFARRIEKLEQLASELGTACHLCQVDVRNPNEIEQALASLPEEFQAIDILVNNAGLGRGLDKLHEGQLGDWNDMIDTNIKGLLYMSRMVIPTMVERGSGHVINVGSIAGHEVYPGGNVYCATKHAVDALTKGMRIDLVDSPVRVSTIDPGLVETEFSEVRFHGDKERAKTVYQGYKPLEPNDIAETAVWISSRPAHVQIAEVIIFPTAQSSAAVVHKE